jgi:hypothetical protein
VSAESNSNGSTVRDFGNRTRSTHSRIPADGKRDSEDIPSGSSGDLVPRSAGFDAHICAVARPDVAARMARPSDWPTNHGPYIVNSAGWERGW